MPDSLEANVSRPAQVLRTRDDEELEAKLRILLIERGYKNVGPTLIYRLALRLLPDYFAQNNKADAVTS